MQVGIPLFMYLVMRAHQIPEIKKKKVGNSLVASMITEYMAATTTASSQRLASFLGMKRDANLVSRGRQAAEFDRRTEVGRRRPNIEKVCRIYHDLTFLIFCYLFLGFALRNCIWRSSPNIKHVEMVVVGMTSRTCLLAF